MENLLFKIQNNFINNIFAQKSMHAYIVVNVKKKEKLNKYFINSLTQNCEIGESQLKQIDSDSWFYSLILLKTV
jgi:hypothetical protein